ncbi:hypothetical protein B0H15DRAFT_952541 [Mycena belliarum]|uniref:Uncharacterized protein n=1 Tax=Mycena belliarum TaxID=1033014 RepID=A0AAD6XLA6_9AGAR|nr:hypothetical protein B0H15DRAFT_952541 [Mycena belliae]
MTRPVAADVLNALCRAVSRGATHHPLATRPRTPITILLLSLGFHRRPATCLAMGPRMRSIQVHTPHCACRAAPHAPSLMCRTRALPGPSPSPPPSRAPHSP